MLHVDFAKSYKNYQQDAIQSAYLENQCFRIFRTCCYAKITMLEITMVSLLPEVPTTIESRLWVGCKKLSTTSNKCMNKHTRSFMYGVMEWGYNLDHAIYSNY